MLKTNNLYYKYSDNTVALKNINIDLDKGNIVALIGGNGAGKSTLFLNLMGILKPTNGEIYYKGTPVEYNKKFKHKYRQEVSLVFQDPDKQIFYSNVYDDVAFALRNIGLDEKTVKKRVEEALEKTGAYKFMDKPVHYLSGGQKKRVAIAGVIAMNSEVILLDEPTAGLDPEMTEGVVDIIENLANEGKKIVISSHDMDLIFKVCDYAYLLKDGEIICDGNVENVFVNEELIKSAGLTEPWLIKIHQRMGFPIFRKEENLFQYWSEVHGNSSHRG